MINSNAGACHHAERRHHDPIQCCICGATLAMNWDFAEVNPMGETGTWLDPCRQSFTLSISLYMVREWLSGRTRARPSRPLHVSWRRTHPISMRSLRGPLRLLLCLASVALQKSAPGLYRTIAAPKVGELTAIPSSPPGTTSGLLANTFINGFTETFRNLQKSMVRAAPAGCVCVERAERVGKRKNSMVVIPYGHGGRRFGDNGHLADSRHFGCSVDRPGTNAVAA